MSLYPSAVNYQKQLLETLENCEHCDYVLKKSIIDALTDLQPLLAELYYAYKERNKEPIINPLSKYEFQVPHCLQV